MDATTINYEILMQMGLMSDASNIIIDQDTYNVIQFNGKNIKYYMEADFNPKTDILFDPIANPGLAKYLLSYFLEKYSIETGKYFNMIFTRFDNDKLYAVLQDTSTYQICSNKYTLESLCYLDLIFKLNDYNYNLSAFDIIEER